MMARYINKDEFAIKFDRECRGECCCCKYATLTQSGCKIIDDFPCADVQEVRHGSWIDDEFLCKARCSVCCEEWSWMSNDMETFNYCPNCGAEMDGETE